MKTCPDCNASLRHDDVECPNCGYPLDSAPEGSPLPAPPTYASAARERDFEYRSPASHGKRIGAALLDGVIFGIVGAVLGVGGMFLFIGPEAFEGTANDPFPAEFWIIIVALWVFPLVVLSLFESSSKRGTPGKQIVGLEVVDSAGGRISFGRALGRNFIKALIGQALPLLIVILVTRRHQGLHDLVARTFVVERGPR